MVYKRVSKIIFAAILAVTVFSGCGNRQEEGIDKTETETTTQKSTQDSTQDVTQEAEEETKYPSITSDGKMKDYKSVVTVDDTAYELYTYLDKVADNYAKSVNKVADTLAGKSDVYDLVIPLSSGITFPDNLKDKISSSDQHDAMQKIQAKMDKHVKNVDVYDVLMQHRTEYEYFGRIIIGRHLVLITHIRNSVKQKGLRRNRWMHIVKNRILTDFWDLFTMILRMQKLKANPDTVTAYYPNAESICHVTASDGKKYDWPVIYDVSNYNAGLKYSTFIASDNPYTEIENKDLSDGSSCIVVKESFGNAFIPFLVDHYQTVYVVDYRYWTGSISKLAQDKNVNDVLFLNNLSMIRNKSLVGKLYRVL